MSLCGCCLGRGFYLLLGGLGLFLFSAFLLGLLLGGHLLTQIPSSGGPRTRGLRLDGVRVVSTLLGGCHPLLGFLVLLFGSSGRRSLIGCR